jgi:hypothetical protein
MKRIKIYLDTNMVIDIFIAQARAVKKGSEYKKPKKYEFMLEHCNKIEFMTSFITKAEVMRELLTGFCIETKRAERMWDDFISTLDKKVHIENFRFDSKIVDIVCKLKLRLRTMFNFMHLFIAIEENAYFVSGDKDLICKIRESGIYDKAIDYIELRKIVSSISCQDA